VPAIEWGVCSDVGHRRARNEDAYVATGQLFAVADGMGGHEGGELASALAVAAIRDLPVPATVGSVGEALVSANASIVAMEQRRPELTGMGTTVVGLVSVVEDGCAYWLGFNIGDSRLYRFAGGALSLVSHDHSVVQELIDSGRLDPTQVSHHPERSVVTRALGGQPAPTPDFWLLPFDGGQSFLLCSDGLTVEVPEDAIAAILGGAASAQSAAAQLVESALASGGRDNVTALVVRHGVSSDDPSREASGHVSDDTVERPRRG
jgi:protein phosphatase